ncbi:MAG: glucose-6-phosphate dehydrogenase assembly protein OpcA [Streptomycetales bacterium]
MIIDLDDTSSARINAALVDIRRSTGCPALGMVLTLVIAAGDGDHRHAVRAAAEAAREHPCRIIAVTASPAGPTGRLDAEIRITGETGPGEALLLRLYGPLAEHADSAVLPLLLPDTPVVTWWPDRGPEVPYGDPLGRLAQRRITDAARASRPLEEIGWRARGYHPGDTDLAWTRLTPWRSLLAAALDQHRVRVTGGAVEAEPDNPSAELLALWLRDRLEVGVTRADSAGPGITAVRLGTEDGDIAVTRPDGRVALLTMPGRVDRLVALKRRPEAEAVAEELRWLDPDDIYASALRRALPRERAPAP